MGYHLTEISNPTQPSPPPTPHATPHGTSQPLDSIPEEDEAQPQQGIGSEAALGAAASKAEDSAALSVGCVLLLELGMEEVTAALQTNGSSTTGDLPAHVTITST